MIRLPFWAAACAALSLLTSPAAAQTSPARLLLQTGDPVPGEPAFIIEEVGPVFTNGTGGYGFQVDAFSDTALKSWVVGSLSGGDPEILWAEGPAMGIERALFRLDSPDYGGFFGLSDAGAPALKCRDTSTNEAHFWVGDQQVPRGERTFELHRFSVTASGTPIWSEKELLTGDVLFMGFDRQRLLDAASLGIWVPWDFDALTKLEVSPYGAHWIAQFMGRIVLDGSILSIGGVDMVVGAPLDHLLGGQPGDKVIRIESLRTDDAGGHQVMLQAGSGNWLIIEDGEIVVRAPGILDGESLLGIWDAERSRHGDRLFVGVVDFGSVIPNSVNSLFHDDSLAWDLRDELDVDGDGLRDAGEHLLTITDYYNGVFHGHSRYMATEDKRS